MDKKIKNSIKYYKNNEKTGVSRTQEVISDRKAKSIARSKKDEVKLKEEMGEKTIESMTREKKTEMNDSSSLGQRGNVLKNVEGDLKKIEGDLKVSTSSEVELGMLGQLRALIEKIKSGHMDLTTAQNLLRSVNTLKGKVSTELNKTDDMINSADKMSKDIDKLCDLLEKEKEKETERIAELEALLKELEERKKNLNMFMGMLMAEKKELKDLDKGIKEIKGIIKKEMQSPGKNMAKPTGLGKAIKAITGAISLRRNRDLDLSKNMKDKLKENNKDGAKNVENEGILKILAEYGEADRVKRILGEDRLKQDLTKSVNLEREVKRNEIENKSNKIQQLEIAEKHDLIKLNDSFMHGKNKVMEPREARLNSGMKKDTKNKTKNMDGREMKS
ncbi:MAG: hypothetical protein J6Y29_03460 [Clostridiales bacterium]|nr:hypothetical protein [Clostridiales bacterium]